MRVDLTYSVKISAHKRVFHDTVVQYRAAVSFFLEVCLKEWELIGPLHGQKQRVNMTEALTVKTKTNIAPVYDFSERFYKFPCYLRRAAIAEALGKVSSYKITQTGKQPIRMSGERSRDIRQSDTSIPRFIVTTCSSAPIRIRPS